MSQQFKANMGVNQSSKALSVNPKLAAALAGLEVELDRELARYRRTCLRERKPNQSNFWKSATDKSIELNSPATQLNQTPLPESENTLTEELTPQFQGSVKEVKAEIPTSPLPQVNPQASNSSRGNTQKPEINLAKEKENPKELNSETTASSGSIVPSEKPKHKQAKTFPEEPTIIQSPEDYLESSEELLRSFSSEQKSTEKPRGKRDGLLTPLGIASMLLLLVACILVGWAAANPGELPKLSFSTLFKQNSDDNPGDSIATGGNTRSLTQPKITSIPKEPNLAAQEFPEVNNPDDVVNLKPKAKSTPTESQAKPTPIASTQQLPSPASQLPIQENPSQTSEGVTSNTTIEKPQTIEETQQTESDADIKPGTDGLYHVVVENLGEESVTQAQKVIPDAYISDDGKFIHLGALKTKERAQKLLSELKAKGVQAKIK